MHDMILLKMLQPTEQITHKRNNLILSEVRVLAFHQTDQITALVHLHHQVEGVLGLEDLVQAQEVLVVKAAGELDLVLDHLLVVGLGVHFLL